MQLYFRNVYKTGYISDEAEFVTDENGGGVRARSVLIGGRNTTR